jgi:universal stress protein E
MKRMKEIKHILVVMDPMCEQQPALVRAISLAKQTSATIELFLVSYNRQLVNHWIFDSMQLALLQEEYVASQLRWLETYVNDVVKQGLMVKIDIKWHKNIVAAVLDKTTEVSADIVIKSTHQHPTLTKLFFTPTDWRLLQCCHVPLLLAKSSSDANQASSYKVIMAAVDPVKSNDKPVSLDRAIIDASAEFAALFEANIHVSHCYQPVGIELWQGMSSVGMDQSLPMMDFNEYQQSIEGHHQKLFDELVDDYGFDDSSLHLASGDVEFELAELVQENQVDLLVMGMGDKEGFIGNTIEKILDNVRCDILSVKAWS